LQNTNKPPTLVELQGTVDALLTPRPTRAVLTPAVVSPTATLTPSNPAPAVASTVEQLRLLRPTSAAPPSEDEANPGAITITFDDGHENAFLLAFPIMKQFGIVGNVAVIVDSVGDPGQLTWEQLDELHNSGWAIVSHSMTHRRLTELSDDELEFELSESHRILSERGYRGADFFVAPFHDIDERVNESIAKHYTASRSIYNYRPQPAPTDGFIGYGAYAGDYSLAGEHEILTVDHLKKFWIHSSTPGNWGPTYFHTISTNTEEGFEKLVRFLHDENIRVVAIDEIFDVSEEEQNTTAETVQ
jgi:peptidoglycan/xylan/chitin deacetylase (PgdA/CDA1 family)